MGYRLWVKAKPKSIVSRRAHRGRMERLWVTGEKRKEDREKRKSEISDICPSVICSSIFNLQYSFFNYNWLFVTGHSSLPSDLSSLAFALAPDH